MFRIVTTGLLARALLVTRRVVLMDGLESVVEVSGVTLGVRAFLKASHSADERQKGFSRKLPQMALPNSVEAAPVEIEPCNEEEWRMQASVLEVKEKKLSEVQATGCRATVCENTRDVCERVGCVPGEREKFLERVAELKGDEARLCDEQSRRGRDLRQVACLTALLCVCVKR